MIARMTRCSLLNAIW